MNKHVWGLYEILFYLVGGNSDMKFKILYMTCPPKTDPSGMSGFGSKTRWLGG